MEQKLTPQYLKQRQSLPLAAKVEMTLRRIEDFYNHFDGKVYISFSGGKDSTVLLHLARKLYPDIEAVFVDTGLEYPEIRDFVKEFSGVTIVRPKMSFLQVIETYGYPVVGKEVSKLVEQARKDVAKGRTDSWALRHLDGKVKDKEGRKSFYNYERWKFLVDAPFKISGKCCNIMKKGPAKDFEKQSGKKPIIGILACESRLRTQRYIKNGCNSFTGERPLSMPMGFWLEEDVLRYIKENKLKIAKVYGDVVCGANGFYTTGVERTGCMFCLFGAHLEGYNNRFVKMKKTHPQIWSFCMNRLKMKSVLDFLKIQSEDVMHDLL